MYRKMTDVPIKCLYRYDNLLLTNWYILDILMLCISVIVEIDRDRETFCDGNYEIEIKIY